MIDEIPKQIPVFHRLSASFSELGPAASNAAPEWQARIRRLLKKPADDG